MKLAVNGNRCSSGEFRGIRSPGSDLLHVQRNQQRSGILIGHELGAGNLERGKLYGNRLVKLAFLCGFLSTGVMLLVTPAVLGFVKLTDAASEYLVGMMVIMAFYMIGRAVNTI